MVIPSFLFQNKSFFTINWELVRTLDIFSNIALKYGHHVLSQDGFESKEPTIDKFTNKTRKKLQFNTTLEPHYNAHFGVHSDMSVITEQPYNEGLIHRKYKEWEPLL